MSWSRVMPLLMLAASGCGVARAEREPSGTWQLRGEPVGRDQVESGVGPEHCEWQEAHFLDLYWPPGSTHNDPRQRLTYVKDPKGALAFAPYLRDGFVASAVLPPEAVDSGLSNGGYRLWYSPGEGDSVVYLVRGARVEAWPKVTTPVGCA